MTLPNSVLIADDDEDIRALVSLILSRAGFVTKAVDGGEPVLAEAHERATCPRCSFWTCGCRTSMVSTLCRQLKAEAHTASRPVLLISAESSPADIEAGFAAGCDDYLPKPFTARELVKRVTQLRARLPRTGGAPVCLSRAMLVDPSHCLQK